MNFQEVFAAAGGEVTNGAPVEWACWGENLVCVAFGVDGLQIAACVVDQVTQRVYALEVFDHVDAMAWRWVDPEHLDEWTQECRDRNINTDWAWSGCRFNQTSDTVQVLEKLSKLRPNYDPS